MQGGIRCAILAVVLCVACPALSRDPYNRVYLDDPTVCNMTIRLHEGLSAVLVQLSSDQLFRPLTCSIQMEIGDAAGLSAVVQDLRVGKFDDPNNCTSYLQVTTFDRSNRYTTLLCGDWSSSLHHLEFEKSLFGICDPSSDTKHGYDCAVRRINLLAHIPGPNVAAWTPKFTVVVTAYFSKQFFGGSCSAGRFLCANAPPQGEPAGRTTERCISQSLVCDGHPNCGFVNNEDEYSSTCSRLRRGPITESDHFFATWAGFAVIVLLLAVAVSYFIHSVRWPASREAPEPAGRPRPPLRDPPPAAQERPGGAPEPPAYESLYPEGPPASALEEKRHRAGAAELDSLGETGTPHPPPPPALGTHLEPASSPEEPPPYSERPALRHSVLVPG